MSNELIIKKLSRLRLPGVTAYLDQRMSQAVQEKWAYSMFLLRGANNSLHFSSRIFWMTSSDKVLDDIRLFLSHLQVTT
jgi:hypothetical protein